MTRIVILLLALAGFSALFAGCGGGGGDENVILAVAFRLDEGTPLMAAYVGDPGEDPFELPAGRYYVEALDEDEVAVSLGPWMLRRAAPWLSLSRSRTPAAWPTRSAPSS
jgi:hypothetical protein